MESAKEIYIRGNFCIRWYSFVRNQFAIHLIHEGSVCPYVCTRWKKKEATRCNKALTFITFQLPRFNRRCWLVIRYSRRKNYQRTEQSGNSWFCAVGANRRDKATCEALVKGLARALESRTRSSMCSLWVPARGDRREEVSRCSHGHKSS